MEQHKATAENQLAVKEETLKSMGMTETQIKRDSQVRHIKAKIRQAAQQLAGLAELESQIARMAETKIEKKALKKSGPLNPKSKKPGK